LEDWKWGRHGWETKRDWARILVVDREWFDFPHIG